MVPPRSLVSLRRSMSPDAVAADDGVRP